MKRILITGANRGIGFELTHQYLMRGERVFATYRQETRTLPELMERYPAQLTLTKVDVTDGAQIQSGYEEIKRHVDGLDLLINNAGILSPTSSFEEVTAEALLQTFATNAVAPIVMFQSFMALLRAGQSPKVINITMPTPPISKLGQRRNNHNYIASRFALNALTRMLALEVEDIIVVAMWPGMIQTDMNNRAKEATPPEEAIPTVIQTIEKLTTDDHGCCILPDGVHYDW